MSNATTQGVLYDRKMTSAQFLIVIVCCLTNIADGADIASLAFAAPVLVLDWGLSPGVMGILFGATAAGLAIGAFLVAPLADKFGRRALLLMGTGIITVAMVGTAFTTTLPQLAALRFITGVCLGTLAVCLNVMVAEFANAKWRNVAVGVLHSGFSVGTMTGGLLAATILVPYGWHSMFVGTGVLNAITFLLILFLVPESPSYVVARGGANALEKLNRIMTRIGQPPVEELPAAVAAKAKAKLVALLGTSQRQFTILLWASQFAFALISYLLLNWKPTVLVNAGMTPAEAGIAGLVSGAAGIIGHILVGYTSRNGREVQSTMVFFVLLCVALLIFGLAPPHFGVLLFSAGFTSFCNVGCFTGLLLIGLNYYPAALRTTSISMLVGIARLGAISGPLFGGLLLQMGFERNLMFVVLAGISLIPIVAMAIALRGWKRVAAREAEEALVAA